MKMEWNKHLNKTINITMNENYGVVYGQRTSEHPTFYEIVFKSGKLKNVYDDGLYIEDEREGKLIGSFIPYTSIKCVDVF